MALIQNVLVAAGLESKPKNTPMPVGQPLVITELDGEKRVLTLERATLPRKGVDAGMRLRSVSTKYPGSSQASTQILGTEDSDITFEGLLRDIQMGQAGLALAATALMESIFRGQRFCQVAWGTTLVRRGYIKEFVPRYHRESWIEYKLVFEVAESDAATVVVKDFVPVDTKQTLWAKLVQGIDDAAALAKSATVVNNVGRAVL